MANSPVSSADPALTDYLNKLTDLAREAGADGMWVVREPDGFLAFTKGGHTVERIDWHVDGLVVYMRFPVSDGRAAGVEKKLGELP